MNSSNPHHSQRQGRESYNGLPPIVPGLVEMSPCTCTCWSLSLLQPFWCNWPGLAFGHLSFRSAPAWAQSCSHYPVLISHTPRTPLPLSTGRLCLLRNRLEDPVGTVSNSPLPRYTPYWPAHIRWRGLTRWCHFREVILFKWHLIFSWGIYIPFLPLFSPKGETTVSRS